MTRNSPLVRNPESNHWVTFLSLSLVIAGCFACTVRAGELNGDFYVSPSGDDSSPGTIDQPFATIDRAKLAIRQLVAGGIDHDIWVYLRGGIYRIESPIVFTPADSPPPDLFIHYAAYPGEHPVISGGRQILNWVDHGNGTWTATVPGVQSGEWNFRELFVNGKRCQRARHPNSGFLTVAGPNPTVGTNTRFTFAFAPGDLPPGTDLANAEINMLHEWTVSRVRVAEVNQSSHTLTTAEPLGATGLIQSIFQTEDHPRYAVENHPALLDAPGEWYLDRDTGVLTYRPRPGEFVQTVDFVAPIATELLVARGDFDLEEPVRNLRFLDLEFEHCAWGLPAGGYSTYQSGYYEWRDTSTPYDLPAAVKFELAQNCQLIRTRVSHCGGWGVMLGAWCNHCQLIGSIVSDIAGNGVIVGEDRYRRVNGIFWIEARPDQVAVDNSVLSNLVQDCGVELQDCAGVWVGLTERSFIHNNVIRRMPHTALSVGGLWSEDPSPCRETSIINNRIYKVVQLLSDGAAIYTVGLQPDSIIRGNLISDIPPQPGLSQNNGIYLDEGSTGFQITDNGIYNVIRSPFKFHLAGQNQLISNTMRLSSPTVQPYFFVSTNPANIVRTGDVVINPALPPPDCAFPVCGEAASAGLLEAYTPFVYYDSDQDGVPDVDDTCVNRKAGDVSGDGSVNGQDIEAFLRVMFNESIDGNEYCAADVNANGIVEITDVKFMVSKLLSSQ